MVARDKAEGASRAAAHTPADGYVDPSSVTHALAKGARDGGAEIYRHTKVTGMHRTPTGEWVVETDKGSVTCERAGVPCGNAGAGQGRLPGQSAQGEPIVIP